MALYLGTEKMSISGFSVITTDSSDADATATDILSGKSAYVNGEKIIGNFVPNTLEDLTSDGTATSEDIAAGEIAYVNGQRIVGTMQNAEEMTF